MNRRLMNCRRKSRPLNTPEHEENTEELLKRAKNLINAEHRDALYSQRAKGRVEHVKNTVITPASSPKRKETAAVKAARLKIRSEWDALKNGSIISDGKSPTDGQPPDKGATALRGIVAYIEMKNKTRLPALKAILENMGASVSNTFSKEVTHVIFKQGSLATVQQAKFLNVHLVSVLWIEACKNSKTKVLEKLFPVVDFNDYTGSPRVFRRFMEMGQKDREKLISTMLQESQDKEVSPDKHIVTRSRSSKSAENSRLQESLTDDSMISSSRRMSNRIIAETQETGERVGSQLRDLANAHERSKESNSSSIRLHVSTDDSSNKISIEKRKSAQTGKENINSESENSISILSIRNPTVNLNVDARRLFASARDSCIDDGKSGVTKKKNPNLKRKLFVGNPVDDSFSKEASDSDFGSRSSLPKVTVINPYKSKEDVRKRKRKKTTNKSKQKSDTSQENINVNTQKKQTIPNNKEVEKETLDNRLKEVKDKATQVKEMPKLVKDKSTQVKEKVIRVRKRLIQVKAKVSQAKSTQVKVRTARIINTVKKAGFKEENGKLPSIVSTSLHTQENKFLRMAIDTLGEFEFKPNVVGDTTHVVAGEPRRTINLLKAISRGCWVLRQQWVINSMSAGRWLPEDSYEMTEFSKVVQKSRIEKQTFGEDYQLDIFTECGAIYVAPRIEPNDKDLKELVTLCGGKIVSLARKSDIVVGEKLVHHDACVSYVWILDSVEQGRCKSLKKYALVGT